MHISKDCLGWDNKYLQPIANIVIIIVFLVCNTIVHTVYTEKNRVNNYTMNYYFFYYHIKSHRSSERTDMFYKLVWVVRYGWDRHLPLSTLYLAVYNSTPGRVTLLFKVREVLHRTSEHLCFNSFQKHIQTFSHMQKYITLNTAFPHPGKTLHWSNCYPLFSILNNLHMIKTELYNV